MNRIRFNISKLVVLILALAIGFAALRESNDLWASGLFTLTVGVLLTTILLVVHRSDARRVFWIGFALFGWGYLALSLVPSIESRLTTTKALAYLDSKVPRTPSFLNVRLTFSSPGARRNQLRSVRLGPDGNQLTTTNQGQLTIWDVADSNMLIGWPGTTENFIRIGHSLLTLLAAWFGGQVSRRLWRASRASQELVEIVGEGTDE
jgi:hypothetical protein